MKTLIYILLLLNLNKLAFGSEGGGGAAAAEKPSALILYAAKESFFVRSFYRSKYNGLIKQLNDNGIKVEIQPIATVSEVAGALKKVKQQAQKLKYLILGGHGSPTEIQFSPFDGSDGVLTAKNLPILEDLLPTVLLEDGEIVLDSCSTGSLRDVLDDLSSAINWDSKEFEFHTTADKMIQFQKEHIAYNLSKSCTGRKVIAPQYITAGPISFEKNPETGTFQWVHHKFSIPCPNLSFKFEISPQPRITLAKTKYPLGYQEFHENYRQIFYFQNHAEIYNELEKCNTLSEGQLLEKLLPKWRVDKKIMPFCCGILTNILFLKSSRKSYRDRIIAKIVSGVEKHTLNWFKSLDSESDLNIRTTLNFLSKLSEESGDFRRKLYDQIPLGELTGFIHHKNPNVIYAAFGLLRAFVMDESIKADLIAEASEILLSTEDLLASQDLDIAFCGACSVSFLVDHVDFAQASYAKARSVLETILETKFSEEERQNPNNKDVQMIKFCLHNLEGK